MVDWFIGDPDATQQAMLVAGIPLLQTIWILIGVVALVVLAVAILHIIHELLLPASHVELHQFGESKQRLASRRDLGTSRS
jgi:hypothetical protein